MDQLLRQIFSAHMCRLATIRIFRYWSKAKQGDSVVLIAHAVNEPGDHKIFSQYLTLRDVSAYVALNLYLVCCSSQT